MHSREQDRHAPVAGRDRGLAPAGRNIWLRGGLSMAADAFVGTVDIVNGVHKAVTRTVSRLAPPARPIGRASDFVYGRVRDVGRLSFFGARQFAVLAETMVPARKRDVPQRLSLGLHSALNGAFGDYLERSDNELALSMSLMDCQGRPIHLRREALAPALVEPTGRVVLLVHGLGLNDQQWRSGEHDDFGTRMTRDFGYTALRLRYNSGRHISENGRDFAALLQALCAAWPVPIERLTIVGHSMGGLVARSACHYGVQAGHAWPAQLTELVFLGSPHLGAPLERLGHGVTRSLRHLSYTRPFSALGEMRSAGVKDLSHGHLRDEDWHNEAPDSPPTPGSVLPALDHVGHFMVAATLARRADDPFGAWLGDLLVPVTSAVGESRRFGRRFSARDQDGRVFYGKNHFALIRDDDVYAAIAEWLEPRVDERHARH